MSTQIRLLLYEQSNLGLYCLFERLLKHFSRRQKQMTFVVIDVLRVKHLPIIQISTLQQLLYKMLVPIAQVLSEGSGETVHPSSLTSAFAARTHGVWK